MRSFGLYLFCLLLFTGCQSNPKTNSRFTDDIYNVFHFQHATVTLVKRLDNGRVSGPYCTAFYITPRRLATAKHCVEDDNVQVVQIAPGITFEFITGKDAEPTLGREILIVDLKSTNKALIDFNVEEDPDIIRATVISIDPVNDIAILELAENEMESKHWLPLANSFQVGQRIYSIGMPRNQLWLLSEGMISAAKRYPNNTTRLLYQGIVAPGASGSPLVNNRGHVIGIVIQYIRDIPGIGIASPVNVLKTLLEQGKQETITLTGDIEDTTSEENESEECDPSVSSCPRTESE